MAAGIEPAKKQMAKRSDMTMMQFFSLVLAFVMAVTVLIPVSSRGEDSAVSQFIKEMRSLGIETDEDILKAIISDDTFSSEDELGLFFALGLGDYDYDSGEWKPYSHQIYAFDAEVFDIARMYTLFLSGVNAIVPDVEITDIREDLSGMTEEMTTPKNLFERATDGKRSVSFLCNGHPYAVELVSYGDWFNEKMFEFMDEVLEKEGCPGKLYEISFFMQYVLLVYGEEERTERIWQWFNVHAAAGGF